jgi:hypothetical protein
MSEIHQDQILERKNPYVEAKFGCSFPVSFITCVTIEPSKKYDENINEINIDDDRNKRDTNHPS